jgi:purine-binding chemotaxis protein CheW
MQPFTTAYAAPLTSLPSSITPRPLVAFRIGVQLFALDAMAVRGALRHVDITPVPLAPAGLVGVAWHGGKAVSVMDLRHVLGLPPRHDAAPSSVLMVAHADEVIALLVDKIEDVLNVAPNDFSPAPVTMETSWRQVTGSVVEHPRGLIAVLDIAGTLAALTQ